MKTDRIEFISSYCDRWCERCSFTARCSTFAVTAAVAMCGDQREGLELAMSTGHPVESDRASRETPDWISELVNVEMTPDERAAFDRQERERDQRVDETPMMRTARALVRDSYRWMSERYEPLSASADPVLKEALEIASYDTAFVSAKVHRALHGRDLYESDDDRDEHPIQNDWNGSAKIAWICLDRSEIAWRLIAQATGEEMPSMLADETRTLRQLVEEAFPRARSFVRPGFDEPDR